jgi:hypothetical protein
MLVEVMIFSLVAMLVIAATVFGYRDHRLSRAEMWARMRAYYMPGRKRALDRFMKAYRRALYSCRATESGYRSRRFDDDDFLSFSYRCYEPEAIYMNGRDVDMFDAQEETILYKHPWQNKWCVYGAELRLDDRLERGTFRIHFGGRYYTEFLAPEWEDFG